MPNYSTLAEALAAASGITAVRCGGTDWRDRGDELLRRHPITAVDLTSLPRVTREAEAYWLGGVSVLAPPPVDVFGPDGLPDSRKLTLSALRERVVLRSLLQRRWPGVRFFLP